MWPECVLARLNVNYIVIQLYNVIENMHDIVYCKPQINKPAAATETFETELAVSSLN